MLPREGDPPANPLEALTRASKKLGMVFIDLSRPIAVVAPEGEMYERPVRDDYSRYTWVSFLQHKDDASSNFERFLADPQANGSVETVRCDGSGELKSTFSDVCNRNCIKQESTAADSPQMSGVAERAQAARTLAPVLFRGGIAELPTVTYNIWASDRFCL